MTVIGLDDTDSRETGGCTTYQAARLAAGVRAAGGTVERTLLVRLNPAVEYKTRGNAAVAVHCDIGPSTARDLAGRAIDAAETDDPNTDPGAVVADCSPGDVPAAVVSIAERAVVERLSLEEVRETVAAAGFDALTAGAGRGLVGALAAVGAWRARTEWTSECIAYREPDRWGTPRSVDRASVFAAADAAYPTVWDTVDRVEDTAVCVPRTPGPVLFGIRGETPAAVRRVADRIESEPVARRHTFQTNQGTDAHLRPGSLGSLGDGRAYTVRGTVVEAPATREGGHVFFTIGPGDGTDGDGDGAVRQPCVAFEPTKRFRDRVRGLRVGDVVTVCGEVGDGTLKLEKFCLRDRVEVERANPDCPSCGRSMASAGAGQGYRCRRCSTTADAPAERPLDRDLAPGWYEVPPVARRHVAKPLVRGGFDAPVHPER